MIKYTYVNVSSKVHNLNPIVKTLWLLCMNTFAILIWDVAWLFIFFLSIFMVGLAANLGLRRLLEAMKPLKPLIAILLFSPIFMLLPELRALTPDSSPMTLLVEGFAYGITLALRFCCIIYAVFIFMMTTKLKDFAYMLIKLGVPYRYAFMLITAFRLIPSVEKYANNIKHAQMARGLKLEDTAKLKGYVNFIKYTIKPVLISSLRSGLLLAISMDSACFGAYRNRVFLDDVVFSKKDASLCFIILLALALGIYFYSTGRLPVLLDLSEAIRRLFHPSGGIF
ncbi:MAG: energy-coupling factor transporter transmembrane component T [Thermoproteota archaeon]